MNDINEVTVRGQVPRDAKYGVGQRGAYCFFTVATGSGKYIAYHNINAFKSVADKCKTIKKGDVVEVSGSLSYRKREQGNVSYYESAIIASEVTFDGEITDDDIPF